MRDPKAEEATYVAELSGDNGHSRHPGHAVAGMERPLVTVPAWLTLIVLVTIVLAVGGAAFLGGYNYRRATETTPEPVTYTVPEDVPFFLDAVLMSQQDGLRLWSVRWLAFNQEHHITIEGDKAKDRLVAFLKDGKR